MHPRADTAAVTTVHVRRAVGGDLESVGWIVARFSPLLLAQAEYRLPAAVRAHVDPEDVVQETWAVVLPKLDDVHARADRLTPPLLCFLSATLQNVANNVKRKFIRAAARRRAAGGRDPLASVPTPATGVVSAAVRAERRGAVLSAIDALEPIDREVIVLRAIEQHENHVVADFLELAPNTVAVRYRRALARLKEELPDSVFAEL